MKRIAIFQDDLDIGGIQKSLINLLNHLNYNDIAVDLYLFKENGEWESLINPNVKVKYLEPMNKIYKYLPFDVAFSKAKYDFTDIDYSYDLAVDYNSYQPWTAICALMVQADKRAMLVHNDIKIKYDEEWKYRVLFNAMKGKYDFFETFICVSEPLIETFKLMTNQHDKEYAAIPNSIDTLEIQNKLNDPIDDVLFDESKINICAVGRLCHQKGYDIMIDEFKKASINRNNLQLYIIGGGPDYEQLKKQIKNNNLSDCVHLLGRRENPFSYMNKCDAFISTSRYEGQGMNIMEAKALGLTIIIPSHLEKYVEGVQGTDNICSAILKIEKKDKIFDDLNGYNTKNLDKFMNL